MLRWFCWYIICPTYIIPYRGYDCPQMQSQLDAIENQGGAAAGNAAGSAEEEEGAAEGSSQASLLPPLKLPNQLGAGTGTGTGIQEGGELQP